MDKNLPILDEYDQKRDRYHRFVSEIEHQIVNILKIEDVVCNAVTFRLKARDSLSKKLEQKGDKYATLSDITDIAGVRIITYYIDDVSKVSKIIEREFVVDTANSIDKSKMLEPDRFGYCSVHYVVEMSQNRLRLPEYNEFVGMKCEIQIRSVLQHAWAEIEHDLGYKSEIAIPKNIRRNFSRLSGLLEIADDEFQQIRSFLLSYQNEAEERIEQKEFQNNELDAVLLSMIVKTNAHIIDLNTRLESLFSGTLQKKVSYASCESVIRQLLWLDICTVEQLYNFIEKNEKHVISVAQKMLASHIQPCYSLRLTIGLDYLCYTELLTNTPTFKRIRKYLDDNHMGSANNNTRGVLAHHLFDISKEIGDV